MVKKVLLWLLPAFLMMSSATLFPKKKSSIKEPHVKVITDPKPNMVEEKYVKLVKMGEIADEITDGVFLFNPFSFTMNKNKTLFIYDNFQGKILELDDNFNFVKFIGRKGPGPGEFSGTGGGYMAFINIGLDGNLYTQDCRSYKVIAYNTGGEHIRDFKIDSRKHGQFDKPVVDSSGNLIFHRVKDDRIVIVNEKDEILFSLENKEMVKYNLFNHPTIGVPAGYEDQFEKRFKQLPLRFGTWEIMIHLSSDSHMVIFFPPTGRLCVVKEKKLLLDKFLWPEKAIEHLKKKCRDDRSHHNLFFQYLTDGDGEDCFYTQFGETPDKKKNSIYKFNLKGELLLVLYIDLESNSSKKFSKFFLKQKGLFFAKEGDHIAYYKEETCLPKSN